MNNYEFCADWIAQRENARGLRVLDYGCGAGQIVELLLAQGVQAFGCDRFYEGGDASALVDPSLLGFRIQRMVGNEIPFAPDSFDAVVNNQVMEHVSDLSTAVGEIHRVLRPGGVVLSLFPDKRVWREGHSGIPFLHWFPKGSGARIYYAAALRSIGFGYHKGDKPILKWSQDFCTWLDEWTHYRTLQAIHSTFESFFTDVHHIEDQWLRRRFAGKGASVVSRLPPILQTLIVRKLAGLVFVARKPGRQIETQR